MLIDPVCFLTCYPQLLYNFVYKVPLLSECLGSIAGLLGAARFLFSRDLIISEVRFLPAQPSLGGGPVPLPLTCPSGWAGT